MVESLNTGWRMYELYESAVEFGRLFLLRYPEIH